MEKIGKYEILKELGSSSPLAVYKAKDMQLGRDVFLKVLTVSAVEDAVLVEQFKHEALTVAGLHHPHLATIYDFTQGDDNLYTAVRFIVGQTLREFLNERKQLSLEEALPILNQLAEVLDYLKSQGLFYQTLDYEKVILDEQDGCSQLVLTDFSLVAEETIEQEVLTTAPVYLVCCLAFEMLAGRPPQKGELTKVNIHSQLNQQADRVVVSDLAEDIAVVLLPGRLTTPIDRYENAGGVVAAIKSVAENRLKENQKASNIAQLLDQAEQAQKAETWLEVQELAVQILKLDQTNDSATDLLATATAFMRTSQEREWQEQQWYEEGKRALETIGRFMNTVESVLEQSSETNQVPTADTTMVEKEDKREEKPFIVKSSDKLKKPQRSTDWLTEQGTTHLSNLPTRRLDHFPKHQKETSRVWGKDGKMMVQVESGEFSFGSNDKVIFLDSFWIDKAPVTNAEYKRFLDANPDYPAPYSKELKNQSYNWDNKKRTYPTGKAGHPVVQVSWLDAKAYARWAGKRLPTEQEWEKAARGRSGSAFPWGGWRNGVANTIEAKIGSTTSVGQFSPAGDSEYGCVDMSGNVWEWTATDYYDTNAKVLRGGSWCNNQLESGCTTRSRKALNSSSNYIGFRLVVSDSD